MSAIELVVDHVGRKAENVPSGFKGLCVSISFDLYEKTRVEIYSNCDGLDKTRWFDFDDILFYEKVVEFPSFNGIRVSINDEADSINDEADSINDEAKMNEIV